MRTSVPNKESSSGSFKNALEVRGSFTPSENPHLVVQSLVNRNLSLLLLLLLLWSVQSFIRQWRWLPPKESRNYRIAPTDNEVLNYPCWLYNVDHLQQDMLRIQWPVVDFSSSSPSSSSPWQEEKAEQDDVETAEGSAFSMRPQHKECTVTTAL